jgi:hypothetical protein
MDLARNLGLSLKTHFVHKEDGYVLQVTVVKQASGKHNQEETSPKTSG